MTKRYRVVLIGSTGFIGSRLSLIFSRCPEIELINLSRAETDLMLASDDLPLELLNKFRNSDAFINCAGHAGGVLKVAFKEKLTLNASNVRLPSKCYVLASQANIGKFIHISTAKVYGESSIKGQSFSLSSPLNPSTPYSRSKAIGEKVLMEIASHSNTELYILRIPIVLGKQSRLLKIAVAILNWTHLPVFVSNKNSISFITIHGLFKCIHSIVKAPKLFVNSNIFILNVKDGDITSKQLLGFKFCFPTSGDDPDLCIGGIFKKVLIRLCSTRFFNKLYGNFVISKTIISGSKYE